MQSTTAATVLTETHTPYRTEPPRPIKNAIRFTRENAAEMQRRSTEARRLRKEALHARIQKAANGDAYLEERLAQTRALIARLEGMMTRQRDPAKLAHLTKALAGLADLEAQLAGRTRTKTKTNAPSPAPLIQAES